MGHKNSFGKNGFNFILMVLAVIPWLYTMWLLSSCKPSDPSSSSSSFSSSLSFSSFSFSSFFSPENPREFYWNEFCALGLERPLVFLNLLFFVCICVLFWVLSIIQKSTWLIDPYWTFIPLLIAHYFQFHPLAEKNDLRSRMALGVIYIWSIRLTHSYFRREEWQFGAREDWRFTEFNKKYPNHWWWMSFFLCYLSQQAFLVGISLPFYAVFTSPLPVNWVDYLATFLCLFGITGAYFADTQLRNFMVNNEKRVQRGLQPIPLLNQGLFYYSRHPNYFFEQVFWWSLYLFAWNLGHAYMAVGPTLNSICLMIVSVMVERRMLRKKEREQILKEYYESTSAMIPWFKFKTKSQKSE